MDTHSVIKEYVAGVLPEGDVSNILLEKPISRDGETTQIVDAEGYVSLGKKRNFPAYFEIKGSLSLATLQATIASLERLDASDDHSHVKLILSPYLSSRMQEMVRSSNVGFIDGAGNAWINADGVLVDRRGNKPDRLVGNRGRNLFSDKATLVPRLLFPGGRKGVREISALLGDRGFGLTPGYVSKLVASLVDEGYAHRSDKGVELVEKALFLEEWSEAYKRKYARPLAEGWYYPLSDMEKLAWSVGSALGEGGALTGRAGALFVDPHALFESVDVLARDRRTVMEVLEGIGAKPVERGANINLIKPDYSISSFFDIRRIEGVPIVSDLQLYLDLHREPRRGVEAAQHLFERRIRPVIEEGAA